MISTSETNETLQKVRKGDIRKKETLFVHYNSKKKELGYFRSNSYTEMVPTSLSLIVDKRYRGVR